MLEIQQAITKAARESLAAQGFLEIVPPVVGPATDPGLRGAGRAAIDWYGKPYKIMSSMIMYKQLAASALGKIFSFSPCVRLEEMQSKDTGRHLSEFWQIDCELAGAGRDKSMEAAEKMLHDVIAHIVKTKADALQRLGCDLTVPKLPFKRLTHSEAVEMAKKLGRHVEQGKEIPWEAERAVSMEFREPFFIVDYPRGSRGFYDKVRETDGTKLEAFDLMYPQGFGEAVSGSQREDKLELVAQKMREAGEKPEDYGWYMELIKTGRIGPSAGFGFGLERLTRFVCGLEHIKDATPWPKLPGVHSI